MQANGTLYFDCSMDSSAKAKFIDSSFNTTGMNKTAALNQNTLGKRSSLSTCPTYQSEVPEHASHDWYWILRDSTADEFWRVLINGYGVEKDWVAWDTVVPFSECNGGGICSLDSWNDFPVKAADSAIKVDNPQDIWTGASDNLNSLSSQIDATFLDLLFGNWNGSTLDTVQVYGLAVSMASQAVLAMNQVKAIGQTQKNEDKQKMIGWIVSAVLMIVPFIGEEAAAAAGLSSAARAIALAGAAANVGYDVDAIVGDPNSAPFLILGWLTGAGGVAKLGRDPDGFEQMAAKRRGMTDQIAKLGSVVDDTASTIQKITRSCSK